MDVHLFVLQPAKTKTKKQKVDEDEMTIVSPSQSKPGPAPAGGNSGKTSCNYGVKCYNKNPKHLQKFSHPTTGTSRLFITFSLSYNSSLEPAAPQKGEVSKTSSKKEKKEEKGEEEEEEEEEKPKVTIPSHTEHYR